MKKIIAFDLDGTLAESKQAITSEMADLLYALARKTSVAVISGGSYNQFKKQFLSHMLELVGRDTGEGSDTASILHNIILLPTSGSRRYEYDPEIKDWKEVHSYPIPEDIKMKAMTLLNSILHERKEEFGIPDEHFGEYIEDRGTQITLSALGQEAPLEKKQLWDPAGLRRRKIQEAFNEAVPEADCLIGGMTSVDILTKGFDKGVGLKHLLEDRGLTTEDMLFIGDAVFEGGNDYAPFKDGIETKNVSGPTETAEVIHSLLQA